MMEGENERGPNRTEDDQLCKAYDQMTIGDNENQTSHADHSQPRPENGLMLETEAIGRTGFVEYNSSGQQNDNTARPAAQQELSRKLFVGGLGWDTHAPDLQQYFSTFGTVSQAEVMYNRDTGVPRGFGFVTFAEDGPAQAAEAQRHHRINHKTAEIKFAVKKGDDRLVTEAFEDKLAKQIFVGRLPHDATPDELKDWAQHLFGSEKVGSAIVVLDLDTKKPRGFGFVTFRSPEMVNESLTTVPEECEFRSGIFVQVKRAKDRGKNHHPRRQRRDKRGSKNRGQNNGQRMGRGSQHGTPLAGIADGQWSAGQYGYQGMVNQNDLMYGYVPVDMTNMVPMVMFPGAMPPHVMAMSTAGPLAPGVVLANGVTLPAGSPSDPKGGSVMFDPPPFGVAAPVGIPTAGLAYTPDQFSGGYPYAVPIAQNGGPARGPNAPVWNPPIEGGEAPPTNTFQE